MEHLLCSCKYVPYFKYLVFYIHSNQVVRLKFPFYFVNSLVTSNAVYLKFTPVTLHTI